MDWHPFTLWRGWFFAYFILTWVMLNIWAVWGVLNMWPATGAIATLLIVNAQTILMFMFYVRYVLPGLDCDQWLRSMGAAPTSLRTTRQLLKSDGFIVKLHLLWSLFEARR